MDSTGAVTDRDRLLFGAGFMFGVFFAMVLLAVIVVTVTEGVLPDADVTFSLGVGIVVSVIAGIGMYLFAFPENRVAIPLGGAIAGSEPEVAAETGTGTDETGDESDRSE